MQEMLCLLAGHLTVLHGGRQNACIISSNLPTATEPTITRPLLSLVDHVEDILRGFQWILKDLLPDVPVLLLAPFTV